MYVALNSFIKSMMAIAVGSYAFSPLEAAVKTIKLQDTGPEGRKYERTLTMISSDEDPLAPVQLEFEDALAHQTPASFYASVKKHGFHLVEATEVETTEIEATGVREDTARAYTTIVMLDDKMVAGLRYDFAKGKLERSINKGMREYIMTTLKGEFTPSTAPEDVFSSLSDPEECDTLFAALKKMADTVPLAPGMALDVVESYDAPKIQPEANFFSRAQTVALPESQVDDVAILTNHEVSLAILTKGLVAQITAGEGEGMDVPPHTQLISEIVTSGRWAPVTAVVLHGNGEDVTRHLSNIPKVILTQDAEVALNIDMLNPVAVIWTLDLARGLHTDNPIKILARTTHSLIDVTVREQLKILHALIPDPAAVTNEQIAQLAHYQLQHTLLSYTQKQGEDITFSAAHRQTLHRQIHRHLHSQLVAKHRHDLSALTVLENEVLTLRLQDKALNYSQYLPDSGDQQLNALLLHHNQQQEAATAELIAATKRLREANSQTKTLQEKVTRLTKEHQDLQQDFEDLVVRLNDKAVIEQAPQGVTADQYQAMTLGRTVYEQLRQAVREHQMDDSSIVLLKWKATKAFALDLEGRTTINHLVRRLSEYHQVFKELLQPDGSLNPASKDEFQGLLEEAGFDKEKDLEPVRRVVHALDKHELKQLFAEVTDHLEHVDLEAVQPDMISVARTGLSYESTQRYRHLASDSPDLFAEAETNTRLRQWMQSVNSPSQVISPKTLQLLKANPELLEEENHEIFVQINQAEWSTKYRRHRVKQLLVYGELMEELETRSHEPVLTTLLDNYNQARAIIDDDNLSPLPENTYPNFDSFVTTVLDADEHKLALLKFIQTIPPEDLPVLSELWPAYRSLYKQKAISSTSLLMGKHSLAHLKNAHEAYLRMAVELEAHFIGILSSREYYLQEQINHRHLIKTVISIRCLPDMEDLMSFPTKGEFATEEEFPVISNGLYELGYADQRSDRFVQLMKRMKAVVVVTEQLGSTDDTFTTLAQNWADIQNMIERGTLKADQVDNFKAQMIALGLDPNDTEQMTSVLRLMAMFESAEKIPPTLDHYRQLSAVMDVETLRHEKVRQVKWELTEEQVEAARLLSQEESATYKALQQHYVQEEEFHTGINGQLQKLNGILPAIDNAPGASLLDRARKLNNDFGQKEFEIEELKTTKATVETKMKAVQRELEGKTASLLEIEDKLERTGSDLERTARALKTAREAEEILHSLLPAPAGASVSPLTKKTTLAQKAEHLTQSIADKTKKIQELKGRLLHLEAQQKTLSERQGSSGALSLDSSNSNEHSQEDLASTKQELLRLQLQISQVKDLESLAAVETELIKIEAIGKLDKTGKELPARLQAASDYITTTQAAVEELTNTKHHYELVHSHSGQLVAPSDFDEGLLPFSAYDILATVANKHADVPDTTLDYHLRVVEYLVVKVQALTDGATVLDNMKRHMDGVNRFLSGGRVTSLSEFETFKVNTGLPNDLAGHFIYVMTIVEPQGWSRYVDDVVQLIDAAASPSHIPASLWTLARSGLTYPQLEALVTVSGELPEYETIYAMEWLQNVKHRIPTASELTAFPALLPSDKEFAPLLNLVLRHPGRKNTGLLDQLTKVHELWVQSLKGTATTITEDDFLNLKLSIKAVPGAKGRDVVARLKLRDGEQKTTKLVNAIRSVEDFDEFRTLLVDVEQLDSILTAGTLTPQVLEVARAGYTPRVVRLARTAHTANPQFYQTRCETVDNEVSFQSAFAAMLYPTAQAVMAGDENLDILQGMATPGSNVHKVIQAVVTAIPLQPGVRVEMVHRNLVMAYHLVATPPPGGIDEFIKDFKRVYTIAHQRFLTPGQAGLDDVLGTYNLLSRKNRILQIFINSDLAPSNIKQYVDLSRGHYLYLKRAVPLATLSAAYEGCTPASFAALHTLVKQHPEVRLVARDAKVAARYHYHQNQHAEYEELIERLTHHSEQLKGFDYSVLRRHQELKARFPGIKKRFTDTKFQRSHAVQSDKKTASEALSSVHRAKTLTELGRSSASFFETPGSYGRRRDSSRSSNAKNNTEGFTLSARAAAISGSCSNTRHSTGRSDKMADLFQ